MYTSGWRRSLCSCVDLRQPGTAELFCGISSISISIGYNKSKFYTKDFDAQ